MTTAVEGLAAASFRPREQEYIWIMFAVTCSTWLIFECVLYFSSFVKEDGIKQEKRDVHVASLEGICSQTVSTLKGNVCELGETGETNSDPSIFLDVDSRRGEVSNNEEISIGSSDQRFSSRSLLPRRMPAIEGLRVIGAMHVVLYHFYSKTATFRCIPCRQGLHWVHIFFCITGLVSYRSCSKLKSTDGLRLAAKRVKALYPLYFISCAITYFSKLWQNRLITSMTVLRILNFTSVLTPPFDEAVYLNMPGWFLQTLFYYWICLPHWAVAARKSTIKGLIIMMIILYVAAFMPHFTWHYVISVGDAEPNYYNYLESMAFYSPYTNWMHVPFGTCVAALLDKFDFPHRDKLETYGASFGVVALSLWIAFFRSDLFDIFDWYFLFNGPFSYPILLLLFIGCSKDMDITSRCLRILGRLGKLSWPMYILHVPIHAFLHIGLKMDVSPAMEFAVVLPAALLVGATLGFIFQEFVNKLI